MTFEKVLICDNSALLLNRKIQFQYCSNNYSIFDIEAEFGTLIGAWASLVCYFDISYNLSFKKQKTKR